MRRLAFIAFAFLACRDGRLGTAASELSVPPSLDVGQAYLGYDARAPLAISNRGRASVELHVETSGSFAAADLVVPGGATVELPVTFTPAALGSAAGQLILERDGAEPVTVALTGEGVAVPECSAKNDCSQVHFDPAAGCVDARVADGAACGASDSCITDGRCFAGVCRGVAVSCEDHDACTVDLCASAEGCTHAPVQCPAALDACHVPACDPLGGCSLEPAADGASCGDNDCVSAHVCIGGACVSRPAPEGSQCAAPSLCRGAGRCEKGTCGAGPPQYPQIAWRWAPPPGTGIANVTADLRGNVYALITQNMISTDAGMAYSLFFTAFDRDGRQRFWVDLTRHTPGIENGVAITADVSANRVYFVARTYNYGTSISHRIVVAQARDATTGALVWEHDLTQGIAVSNSSDGRLWLDANAVLLLDGGDVVVQLTEGEQLHQGYLITLDRATGAEKWRAQRSGHFGFVGANATGLWEVSAACWSSDTWLSLTSSGGAAVTHHPSSDALIALSDDEGIISSQGDLGVLSRLAVGSYVVQRPPGLTADPWSLARVNGDLVTWVARDAQRRQMLNRSDSTTRQLLWSVPFSAANDYPDLRLLTDGGSLGDLSLADGGREIVTWASDGTETLRCAYPAGGTVAIVKGRHVTQSWSSNAIEVFEVPGLDTETSGWPTRAGVGGMHRTY